MSELPSRAWQLGAVEAGAALASGVLTATTLVEAALERLAVVNPLLNALIS